MINRRVVFIGTMSALIILGMLMLINISSPENVGDLEEKPPVMWLLF